MPNIKAISDLRNYTQVLNEVSFENPVYLTRNGKGVFAIVDMKEYDELKAFKKLHSALQKGEASAKKEGWISIEELKKELGISVEKD